MLKPDAALRKDRANARQPVLQHRHYAVIAGIIASLKVEGEDARREIAEQFADRMATTNGNFDRARFLKACLD
jgi:hypothetical protein